MKITTRNVVNAITIATLSLPALHQMAHAQSLLVKTVAGQTTLSPNPAMVGFVPSNANTATAAAKDVALSAAKGQVAANVLRAVPIPIVGPFMGPLVGVALKKFHSPKPTVGFSIAYVNGSSAAAVVPGDASFTIPAQSLQGASPSLLRVKLSPKDSTRIVRSLRLSVKVTGGAVKTDGEKPEILGVEQDVVPCRQETRNGDVIMTPQSPLESGEYAVALLPASQDTMAPVGLVWDFRVDSNQAPKTPPLSPVTSTETKTISLGQTPSQVTAIFGEPEKAVNLGTKQIYFYKGLRVTFVNSKVADVQ